VVAAVDRPWPAEPGPRVTIVVQNLSVPFDRRVWLECRSLVGAGYRVSVICPMGPGGESSYEELDGVRIHRYPPPPAANGFVSYAWEFGYCWARTATIARRIARTDGMDVLQACNPPDTYFALARLLRRHGVRFVFDQHDLCPEVYESRFDRPSPWLHRALLGLEQATYRTADHVIATNESYREVAMHRGHRHPDDVTVVRTGPDPARLRRGAPDPALRRGRAHLVTYLGVMGPQDGVDHAVRAIDHLVHEQGRTDTTFALVGDGDARDDIVALVHDLGLDDVVDLPGRVPDDVLFRYLSTSDVGLSPDAPSPLNDVSTMNKTMEYMAFELPVVAFALKETMVSAADAAVYAPGGNVAAFALLLSDLLDDPGRRAEMGARGRRRVEDALAWDRQAPAYLGVYDRLTGRADRAAAAAPAAPAVGSARR
jgi:glycosyltransferase involved in cell wall biosynthesis